MSSFPLQSTGLNIIPLCHFPKCLADVDVNIVVSVRIILLQCAVDLLDQGLYVMHVVLCGQIRLVIMMIIRDYNKTINGPSLNILSFWLNWSLTITNDVLSEMIHVNRELYFVFNRMF